MRERERGGGEKKGCTTCSAVDERRTDVIAPLNPTMKAPELQLTTSWSCSHCMKKQLCRRPEVTWLLCGAAFLPATCWETLPSSKHPNPPPPTLTLHVCFEVLLQDVRTTTEKLQKNSWKDFLEGPGYCCSTVLHPKTVFGQQLSSV